MNKKMDPTHVINLLNTFSILYLGTTFIIVSSFFAWKLFDEYRFNQRIKNAMEILTSSSKTIEKISTNNILASMVNSITKHIDREYENMNNRNNRNNQTG